MLDDRFHHRHQFLLSALQNGDKAIGTGIEILHALVFGGKLVDVVRQVGSNLQFGNTVGHRHHDFALIHFHFKFGDNLIAAHIAQPRREAIARLGVEFAQRSHQVLQFLLGDAHTAAHLIVVAQSQFLKVIVDERFKFYRFWSFWLLAHLNQKALTQRARANAWRVEALHQFQHPLHIFTLHFHIGAESDVVGNTACGASQPAIGVEIAHNVFSDHFIIVREVQLVHLCHQVLFKRFLGNGDRCKILIVHAAVAGVIQSLARQGLIVGGTVGVGIVVFRFRLVHSHHRLCLVAFLLQQRVFFQFIQHIFLHLPARFLQVGSQNHIRDGDSHLLLLYFGFESCSVRFCH